MHDVRIGAPAAIALGAILLALTVPPLLPAGAVARADTSVVLNSFFGIPNNNPWNPPDPNGACGPQGILHVNNDGVRYLTKAGSIRWYGDLGTFFGAPPPPDILNDPRAVYDPESQRFFATCSEFAITGGPSSALHAYLIVMVSTSSHPVTIADWTRWRFDVTQVVGSGPAEAHYAPDYPTFGIDHYGLHICGNFHLLPLGSGFFRDVGILTFPKAQLLAGGDVTPLVTYLPPGVGFTLQPVSVLWSPPGPPNTTYFVETPLDATTGVRLWALSDPLGARTLASATIAVPDHGVALDQMAPQPGTDVGLRTWSGMAQGVAQWRDGAIWFASTGDVDAPLVGVDHTTVHWYSLAANGFPSGTPLLLESGIFDAGEGVWNYLPTIGLTPRGDVGIAFQQSSSQLTPRMLYATRPLGAPEFALPRLVAASAASALYIDWCPFLCRDSKWGDDYCVTADPADSSLWLSCELAQPNQTGTTPLWIHEWANLIFDDDLAGWPEGGRRVRQGQTLVDGAGIAADDSGGAYLGWYDSRPLNGAYSVMCGERLLPSGRRAGGWSANGSSLGLGSRSGFRRVVADGSGGAYFVYSAPLTVVRRARSGAAPPGWPQAPDTIAGTVLPQLGVAGDGAGGLLVAYIPGGLKLQRVLPTGALAWTAPPTLASSAGQPAVLADFTGGAYVAWVGSVHVRLQHVLATGAIDPAWPAAGLDFGLGALPRLVADGAGGAYVVYLSGGDVLARRFLATGAPAPGWANAVPVCSAPGTQAEVVAVADGSGGFLAAWSDMRDPATASDIYAQRMTGNATPAPGWPANGVRACAAAGDQTTPAIANDGAGGAVLAWTDYRSEPGCTGPGCGSDVYWTHVTGRGALEGALGADGAAACAEPGDQSNVSLALTGSGTAIAAWLDGRSTPDGDPDYLTQVYAQQLVFDAAPPAAVADLSTSPSTCTAFDVTWTAPGDDGATGTAAGYDLRFGHAPITAANFASLPQLATPRPQPAGSAEHLTIDFGACSDTLYLALVAIDDAGNVSALSNRPPGIATWCGPPPCVLATPRTPLVDALGVPRPNPASRAIALDVSVAEASAGRPVECAIYDVGGRLVRRLLGEKAAAAGGRSLAWDLLDGSGRRVGSGLYFVRLRIGPRTLTRTLSVR